MTIVARVAQVTSRSMLVIPHGDQERAAWLHFNEDVQLGDQLLDGRNRIFLPRSLAETRGLKSAIEA